MKKTVMDASFQQIRDSRSTSPRQGRRAGRWVLLIALTCAAGPLTVCAADSPLGELLNFLFRQRREALAEAVETVEVMVEANAGAEFKPALKGLLGRELHLIRKVCRPNAEQFAQFRMVGLAAVDVLARKFAAAQDSGLPVEQWPRPRPELTAALLTKVRELLPAEAAAEYQAELEAREAAQRRAAQGMMLVIIDRKLTLLPDQFDPLAAALDKHWNDNLSRNMQIYLYDQYVPLPNVTTVAPVLNERQKKLYSAGLAGRGRISFGWEQDLNLDAFGQDAAGADEFGTLEAEAAQPPAEEGK